MNYQEELNKIAENALLEDGYKEDITSNILIDKKENITCSVITRTQGVVSGVEIACKVYNLINPKLKIKVLKESGSFCNRGDVILALDGPVRDILRGQRVVENFLQRLSSIATLTQKYVQEVANTECQIIDSRNTTPGIRILEKRAVIDGGGYNDISKLNERIVITRNHLMINNDIKFLVEKILKSKDKKDLLIQIEVEDLEDFNKALDTECDIIFLNDFNLEKIYQAVELNNKKKILVAKGNYSLSQASSVAKLGVDYIALESITSNIKPLDISVRFYKH